MRTNLAALFLLLASSTGHAQVVGTPPVVTGSDSRLIGRAVYGVAYRDFSTMQTTSPIEWETSIGVGYARGEDDSTTAVVPFEIAATLPATRTILKLIGGYTRSEFGDFDARGLSDITLQVIQPVGKVLGGAVLAALAVSLPTGTDVSANHASQSAALYFFRPLAPNVRMLAVAQASHTNIPLPPGISKESYAGVLRLKYGMEEDFSRAAWFQYVESRRSGTKNFRQVTAAFETQIADGLAGRISASRGLTDGAKATRADLTLTWSF